LEHSFKGIQNLGSNNDLINLSPRILDEPLKVFQGTCCLVMAYTFPKIMFLKDGFGRWFHHT